MDESQRQLQEQTAKRQKRVAKFGHVKNIVHADFRGSKFVAVGGALLASNPEKPWRTFIDFALDYLKIVLGTEWWTAECKKPVGERHELVQLAFDFHDHSKRFQAGPDDIIRGDPDGASLEFVSVAYDLYILRHHQLCQRRLLNRLRNPTQYPGARIELAAAATFLRAGFSLRMEDEKGKGKHPEFVATHLGHGTEISVEAKRRHRVPGSSDPSLGVAPLVRDAFEKIGSGPFALYLELNAPPPPGDNFVEAWKEEIGSALDAKGIGRTEAGFDRFSIALVTNRWMKPGEKPTFQHLTIVPVKSERPISPDVVDALRTALTQTLAIPTEFEAD